jgi:hypothetical protein
VRELAPAKGRLERREMLQLRAFDTLYETLGERWGSERV